MFRLVRIECLEKSSAIFKKRGIFGKADKTLHIRQITKHCIIFHTFDWSVWPKPLKRLAQTLLRFRPNGSARSDKLEWDMHKTATKDASFANSTWHKSSFRFIKIHKRETFFDYREIQSAKTEENQMLNKCHGKVNLC